jgi:hypothetical protein
LTAKRRFAVGEVALSKDEPLSVDLTMFPELPTATKQPLLQLTEEEEELSVVAVLLSSDFAHEETSTAMMTINKNHDNKHFILFLIRKCCKIKPTHSQVTSIGLFYKNVGILLGECLTVKN